MGNLTNQTPSRQSSSAFAADRSSNPLGLRPPARIVQPPATNLPPIGSVILHPGVVGDPVHRHPTTIDQNHLASAAMGRRMSGAVYTIPPPSGSIITVLPGFHNGPFHPAPYGPPPRGSIITVLPGFHNGPIRPTPYDPPPTGSMFAVLPGFHNGPFHPTPYDMGLRSSLRPTGRNMPTEFLPAGVENQRRTMESDIRRGNPSQRWSSRIQHSRNFVQPMQTSPPRADNPGNAPDWVRRLTTLPSPFRMQFAISSRITPSNYPQMPRLSSSQTRPPPQDPPRRTRLISQASYPMNHSESSRDMTELESKRLDEHGSPSFSAGETSGSVNSGFGTVDAVPARRPASQDGMESMDWLSTDVIRISEVDRERWRTHVSNVGHFSEAVGGLHLSSWTDFIAENAYGYVVAGDFIFFNETTDFEDLVGATPGEIRLFTSVEPYSKDEANDQDNCSICLVDFESEGPVRKLQCEHIFHTECIDRWLALNKKCPICRADIDRINISNHW